MSRPPTSVHVSSGIGSPKRWIASSAWIINGRGRTTTRFVMLSAFHNAASSPVTQKASVMSTGPAWSQSPVHTDVVTSPFSLTQSSSPEYSFRQPSGVQMPNCVSISDHPPYI